MNYTVVAGAALSALMAVPIYAKDIKRLRIILFTQGIIALILGCIIPQDPAITWAVNYTIFAIHLGYLAEVCASWLATLVTKEHVRKATEEVLSGKS